MFSARFTWLLLLGLWACHSKTGLVSNTLKPLALHAYYYEGEQTLFVFYSLQKPDNFKQAGALEWSTSRRGDQTWQDVATGSWVHSHRQTSCGEGLICNSFSVSMKTNPSTLSLRYRYDEGGQDADVFFIPVARMAATQKSFLIFGSFANDQRSVVWEGRHLFPDLSQEDVARFGLVRTFSVNETHALAMSLQPELTNSTLYDSIETCPGLLLNSSVLKGTTLEGLWVPRLVPDESVTPYSGVCAKTEVVIGTGNYAAVAFARKNPIVESLPGKLGIEVAEAQPVNLVLAPCTSPTDPNYLSFQMQEMLMPKDTPSICWDAADFASNWQTLMNRLLSENPSVPKYLRLVWHHSLEGKKRLPVESAIDTLLSQLYQSFPKLAGTFLYDSSLRASRNPELFRYTVWCRLDSTVEDDNADYCGLLLSKRNQDPTVSLDTNVFPTLAEFNANGNFKNNTVEKMQVYAPVRGEGVRILPFSAGNGPGYFGTFYTGDVLNLLATDRLSYCNKNDSVGNFAFLTAPDNDQPGLPAIGPLAGLSRNHELRNKDSTYNIGMTWTNPFLVALDIRQKIKVNAIVKFILNIPDALQSQQSFGETLWYQGSYSYDAVLTRCSRYCEHPAYDSTGIYHYESTWNQEYGTRCYEPKIPVAPAVGGG